MFPTVTVSGTGTRTTTVALLLSVPVSAGPMLAALTFEAVTGSERGSEVLCRKARFSLLSPVGRCVGGGRTTGMSLTSKSPLDVARAALSAGQRELKPYAAQVFASQVHAAATIRVPGAQGVLQDRLPRDLEALAGPE